MDGLHKPTWRTLEILGYISRHPEGVTLQECADKLEIPVGTAYPIVKTLVQLGWADFSPSSKRYTVGYGTYRAGIMYADGNAFKPVEKVLKKLTEACGETSHFAILDEKGNVYYIAKIETSHMIRMHSKVGARIPAYGTGLGKALLCQYSIEELKALYPDGLKALTPNTITDFDVLKAQLDDVLKTGYSYECEENNESVRCVGRPLMVKGKVKAAISVAVPLFRYSSELEDTIERELLIASEQIEAFLPHIRFQL